ncbi:MAG: biotin/lipoyl-binding protein, partial [Firmicutes bacterium]|nr:biotin/lipoyl-binding protein [Bacillota bacterium]
ELFTQMPGKVVKINVKEGQEVKKGDTLLILEAMKMENEIMAPKSGKVVSVHVSAGTSVNNGDVLVSIG